MLMNGTSIQYSFIIQKRADRDTLYFININIIIVVSINDFTKMYNIVTKSDNSRIFREKDIN